MTNATIFQVLVMTDMGAELQNWYESREEAEKELERFEGFFPDEEYWIEEGTDYITSKCRGCGSVHANECCDAHGISTGYWCDDCYNSSKYPYRKDAYPTMETHGYGERLEDDY